MAGLAPWADAMPDAPLRLLVSAPLTLFVCVGMLRPPEAAFIRRQHATRASEGRIDR